MAYNLQELKKMSFLEIATIAARKTAEEEIFGDFLKWYEETKQAIVEKNQCQEG